ncbi:MAG: ATP-binding protein [Ignavibacteriales bacterium]|nr:ATP-binding protein [Ignavibacteriales bacterium]
MKNIFNNIFSSRFFGSGIFAASALLFFICSFSFSINGYNIIYLFVIILIFDIAIHFIISKKRNTEIEKIKNVIQSIRNNNFTSPDEILLDKSLAGLQEEIQAMFLKSKNDIDNLKRLERVRTEFLGNVSHELRTPIFAIQGFLETLLDGAIDDPKVNKSFLKKANNHTENLNQLLNDLIDISMIESGEMHLSFRYFNIKEFLEQIVFEIKHLAEEKNIELLLLHGNENLQLFGDKNKLKQVMINLIQNAIKYTEQGKVEVIIEEKDKFAKIIVKDSGIGIAKENLNRIFERFYRVDKDRSRAIGGTGLGLAIAKHIIEAHSSKIEVDSDLGKGSTFWFNLKK